MGYIAALVQKRHIEAGLKFPAAVSGRVGVMTRNSRRFVDDFSLGSRAVLN